MWLTLSGFMEHSGYYLTYKQLNCDDIGGKLRGTHHNFLLVWECPE
jgi:hypothetical protein